MAEVDRVAEVERMQAEYARTVSAEEYDRTVQLYERMLRSEVGARQVVGGEFCGTIPGRPASCTAGT